MADGEPKAKPLRNLPDWLLNLRKKDEDLGEDFKLAGGRGMSVTFTSLPAQRVLETYSGG